MQIKEGSAAYGVGLRDVKRGQGVFVRVLRRTVLVTFRVSPICNLQAHQEVPWLSSEGQPISSTALSPSPDLRRPERGWNKRDDEEGW